MTLVPLWPPRARMALIALIASVFGAASFTGIVAWIVWILWRGGWPVATAGQRIEALAWAMLASLATAAITITALGMAINRRSIKVDGPGGTSVDISGGSDDMPAAMISGATETAVATTGEKP